MVFASPLTQQRTGTAFSPWFIVSTNNRFFYSFSRGEGAVVMVLKPLDAAIKDNDKIYATVSSDFP